MNSQNLQIAKDILYWYDQNKRDLPWRKSKDPYSILVSEIMLQQTRVEAVKAKYSKFLEQFPDLQTLANVSEESLLKAWQGLGYYRRARNLQKACQEVDRRFQGKFPCTSSDLKDLSGIGEYTAAAVASIAFEEVVPVIDGNVIRIVSRIFAIGGDPYKAATRKLIQEKFESGFFVKERPGDFNQAMMELGAIQCTPKSPDCENCVVQSHCLAYEKDLVNSLPELKKKEKSIPVYLYLLLSDANKEGRVTTKTWKGYQSGFLMVPFVELGEECSDDQLRKLFEENWSISLGEFRRGKEFTHGITRYRIRVIPLLEQGYSDKAYPLDKPINTLLQKSLTRNPC